MANMVRFGLKNVHYAVYEESDYGTVTPLAGAVSMTTTPEGDSYTFYADDVAFYVTETNNGYSGTLTVAAVNDKFLQDVLGYQKDATSGLTYETTDTVIPSVALMYEVGGNTEHQRGILYNVTFSRLEGENNTRSDSTEPDTVTLNFTAIGRDFTVGGSVKNVVKAHCSDSEAAHDAYDSFFDEVVKPGTAVGGA